MNEAVSQLAEYLRRAQPERGDALDPDRYHLESQGKPMTLTTQVTSRAGALTMKNSGRPAGAAIAATGVVGPRSKNETSQRNDECRGPGRASDENDAADVESLR